jgi:hypothetical protein
MDYRQHTGDGGLLGADRAGLTYHSINHKTKGPLAPFVFMDTPNYLETSNMFSISRKTN